MTMTTKIRHRKRYAFFSLVLLLLALCLPGSVHCFSVGLIDHTKTKRNHGSGWISRHERIAGAVMTPPRLYLSTKNRHDDGEPDAIVPDLVADDDNSDDDDDGDDWIPDQVKARHRREKARIRAEKVSAAAATDNNKDQKQKQKEKRQQQQKDATTTDATPQTNNHRPSPYTDEEETLIAAMGGKTMHPQRKREVGYLGDSTLSEIATDYSIPVCYLADVLCLWGVPVPIDVYETRLGDMVTGEQAFAILEAVNSLDVAALHDRYSNTSLRQLCFEWNIDLGEAFAMAVKEGWSLPFGVQTCLRVEQAEELIRVLGRSNLIEDDYDDDGDDDDEIRF